MTYANFYKALTVVSAAAALIAVFGVQIAVVSGV